MGDSRIHQPMSGKRRIDEFCPLSPHELERCLTEVSQPIKSPEQAEQKPPSTPADGDETLLKSPLTSMTDGKTDVPVPKGTDVDTPLKTAFSKRMETPINGLDEVSPASNEGVPVDEGTEDDASPDQDDNDTKGPIRRTVFTKRQLSALESRFIQQSFLSKEERKDLADSLQLTERQIMIWFQNRRGRLKRKGAQDSAYNPTKLHELHHRRPYPFLYGLMSQSYHHPNMHQDIRDMYPNGIPDQAVASALGMQGQGAKPPAPNINMFQANGTPQSFDNHNPSAFYNNQSYPPSPYYNSYSPQWDQGMSSPYAYPNQYPQPHTSAANPGYNSNSNADMTTMPNDRLLPKTDNIGPSLTCNVMASSATPASPSPGAASNRFIQSPPNNMTSPPLHNSSPLNAGSSSSANSSFGNSPANRSFGVVMMPNSPSPNDAMHPMNTGNSYGSMMTFGNSNQAANHNLPLNRQYQQMAPANDFKSMPGYHGMSEHTY